MEKKIKEILSSIQDQEELFSSLLTLFNHEYIILEDESYARGYQHGYDLGWSDCEDNY